MIKNIPIINRLECFSLSINELNSATNTIPRVSIIGPRAKGTVRYAKEVNTIDMDKRQYALTTNTFK